MGHFNSSGTEPKLPAEQTLTRGQWRLLKSGSKQRVFDDLAWLSWGELEPPSIKSEASAHLNLHSPPLYHINRWFHAAFKRAMCKTPHWKVIAVHHFRMSLLYVVWKVVLCISWILWKYLNYNYGDTENLSKLFNACIILP